MYVKLNNYILVIRATVFESVAEHFCICSYYRFIRLNLFRLFVRYSVQKFIQYCKNSSERVNDYLCVGAHKFKVITSQFHTNNY